MSIEHRLKHTDANLKAPFGWVGGKHYVAKNILPLIPAHELYVEVFGGGLSLFYQKKPSKREVINDYNEELINLHLAIRNSPETLRMYINELLPSRQLFYMIKHKELKPRCDIERAAFYFFLIKNSFGSSVRTWGMFDKTEDSKNKRKGIYREFTQHSRRLKMASIENRSFEYILKEYDHKNAFFYCDPPYYKFDGNKYYKNLKEAFNEDKHKLLNECLKKLKGKFILSYNDCEFIRELYKDFKQININVRWTLNNGETGDFGKKVGELLIMNFDPYQKEKKGLFDLKDLH